MTRNKSGCGNGGCGGCSVCDEEECTDLVLEVRAVAVIDGAAGTASGTGAGASNFGTFSFTFEETLGTEYSGTETLTFDDEDASTIERKYTGVFADNGSFVQSSKIVDGTGRFKDASGCSIQAGQAADVTAEGFTWIGTDRGEICVANLDDLSPDSDD